MDSVDSEDITLLGTNSTLTTYCISVQLDNVIMRSVDQHGYEVIETKMTVALMS